MEKNIDNVRKLINFKQLCDKHGYSLLEFEYKNNNNNNNYKYKMLCANYNKITYKSLDDVNKHSLCENCQ